MELELKKTAIDAYESIGEIVLAREETSETIVPDYCPDIARIIETDGKVLLHSPEKRDGKTVISGTIKVTVLYVPEGTTDIHALDLAIPVQAECDHKGLNSCQHIFTETDIESLETRMLNPRKVFIRCKLIFHMIGYQPVQIQISTDIATTDRKNSIEKRTEQLSATFLTRLLEKDFTFVDCLNLSSGRESVSKKL